MKIVKIISFFVILLMITTSASGSRYDNKVCEKPLSSSDIDNCTRQKYQSSELLLKSEYLSLIARVDESYRNDIVLKKQYSKLVSDVHKSWQNYRNLSCELESFEIDVESVAHETIKKSCLEKMNNERIILLRATLQ